MLNIKDIPYDTSNFQISSSPLNESEYVAYMNYTNASDIRDNCLMDNGLEPNEVNWNKVSRILTHNQDLQRIIESQLFTLA